MRRDKRRVKNQSFERAVRMAAVFSVVTAFSVAVFILLGALPAMSKLGLRELFGILWQPMEGKYGVTAMLITSLTAAVLSAMTAFAISVLSAAWLQNFAPDMLNMAVNRLCGVMSGIPTVIFGLWGLVTVIPLMQRLFPEQTAKSGGASLLAAVTVLAFLQLPFMLPECAAAIEQAKKRFDNASLALGAEKTQNVFLSQLFHAKNRLRAVLLAGIRLAFCETMAVQFVSGNIASLPKLFGSVRLLGAGLMLEMGYAQGIHRSALFFIGAVMLAAALLTEFFSAKK